MDNRKKYVLIKNTNSSVKTISFGIPQGSVMGPILFLFYVNDLPTIIDPAKTILYADDTTISFSHSNFDYLIQTMNNSYSLASIFSWCIANKLTINATKT